MLDHSLFIFGLLVVHDLPICRSTFSKKCQKCNNLVFVGISRDIGVHTNWSLCLQTHLFDTSLNKGQLRPVLIQSKPIPLGLTEASSSLERPLHALKRLSPSSLPHRRVGLRCRWSPWLWMTHLQWWEVGLLYNDNLGSNLVVPRVQVIQSALLAGDL